MSSITARRRPSVRAPARAALVVDLVRLNLFHLLARRERHARWIPHEQGASRTPSTSRVTSEAPQNRSLRSRRGSSNKRVEREPALGSLTPQPAASPYAPSADTDGCTRRPSRRRRVAAGGRAPQSCAAEPLDGELVPAGRRRRRLVDTRQAVLLGMSGGVGWPVEMAYECELAGGRGDRGGAVAGRVELLSCRSRSAQVVERGALSRARRGS